MKKNLFYLFLISLAGHLAVLGSYNPIENNRSSPEPEYLEVLPLEPEDLEKISARQIIELPPGPDQEPEQAKYLSERAVRAEKEQMAEPGSPQAEKLSPPISPRSLFETKPTEKKTELIKELKPDLAEVVKFIPKKPGCVDFLDGAVLGEITFASAYKFKYAQFFNQLKRSIAFYWNPIPALYIIPPTSGDLLTRIRFVLNEKGFLVDQEVIRSSGFKAIDRAGLEAIKNATPIFGLPEELLDQNRQLVLVCEFRILLRGH